MDGLRMENPMIWGYPHDLGNLHNDVSWKNSQIYTLHMGYEVRPLVFWLRPRYLRGEALLICNMI